MDVVWNAVLSPDICAYCLHKYLSFLPVESNCLVLRVAASLSHVAENWQLGEKLCLSWRWCVLPPQTGIKGQTC